MSRFTLPVLACLLVTACGTDSPPASKSVAPLTAAQRARFEETVNAIADTTTWQSAKIPVPVEPAPATPAAPAPAPVEPAPAPATPAVDPTATSAIVSNKPALEKSVSENCQLQTKTEVLLPLPPEMKFPPQRLGTINDLEGASCPITYQFKTHGEYAVNPETNESVHTYRLNIDYAQNSPMAASGLDVQKYLLYANMTWIQKVDAVSGVGFAEGILKTTSWGGDLRWQSQTNYDILEDKTVRFRELYTFLYKDRTAVQLTRTSTFASVGATEATAEAKINGEPISSKEIDMYLQKIGVEQIRQKPTSVMPKAL